MPFRRPTARATAAAALAPAVLLTVAGPARADGPTDPTTLPSCNDVATAYGDYEQHSLRTALAGAPTVVVAGDGWHEFTGTVTNIGDTALPLVAVQASAWRETDGGTELGPYAEVQVATADGGWRRLAGGSSGFADPAHDLAAHASATYRFRFAISADAPRDVTYGEVSIEGIFADTYTAPGTTDPVACAGDSAIASDFAVRAAGSTPPASAGPTATPTPTPTATHSAPAAGTGTPSPGAGGAAGATAAPDTTAQLADTGAPSDVPLLTGLGALVVAAGAAVLAVTRRRSDRTA
jgi:hypothetical protein